MFKITTNLRKNKVIISQDGYALYNDTYKCTLPTYKVSMSIDDFIAIFPDAIIAMSDEELTYRVNTDVNFHATMDELVLKKDNSLHFIRKLGNLD